jgi:hypothetical protein
MEDTPLVRRELQQKHLLQIMDIGESMQNPYVIQDNKMVVVKKSSLSLCLMAMVNSDEV